MESPGPTPRKAGSSSPRRQSFFDVASELIASIREGRSPTSAINEDETGLHSPQAEWTESGESVLSPNVNHEDEGRFGDEEQESGSDDAATYEILAQIFDDDDNDNADDNEEDIDGAHPADFERGSVDAEAIPTASHEGNEPLGLVSEELLTNSSIDIQDDEEDEHLSANDAGHDAIGEDSGNGAGHPFLARITNRRDDVVDVDDDNFNISIDSPAKPRPAITNSGSKTVVVPSLPAIDELIVSTLDVGKQGRLQHARQRVGRALQAVLDVLPVTKMTPECYEAVEKLNDTGEPLDPHFAEELRSLGAILRGVPVPRLSPDCYHAVEQMAVLGAVLEMPIIMELEASKALEFCAEPFKEYHDQGASEMQLAELRAAVAACTLESLETSQAPELLSLWSLVHTSVSSKITAEAADEAAHNGGHQFAEKKKTSVGSLRLSRIQVVDDQDSDDDNDSVDPVKMKEIVERIAQDKLEGLQKTLTLSRQRVDDALQTIREGRQVIWKEGREALERSWFTAATFALPPLLRLEIVRDFFQIAGLFFAGLYDPILAFLRDQKFPAWIYVSLTWMRNVYSWLAMDISQLMRYLDLDRNLWSKVSVALLLSGILIVHWSFLAVVFRLWWTMPRTADKVRHGHEATTWATFASQNAWTTKFATIFITICLTVYLPLTQMSFNVLVVTHNPADSEAMKSVHFASQYRSGPYWFFFPLEAILLLFTFTLSLPFLLVWSIWKNRPSGSLEDEDVTYDLDGEKVKFDDKVYTELVSSDPSQLGCPYRSLYAGFERNWSTYKVMQMVAKILMAVIVVSAGKSVQIGGTLISVFYFLVVGLSKYSQPFIDPFDDWMEFVSKLTALATAVGATAVAYAAQQKVVSSTTTSGISIFMGFVVVLHGVNLLVMLSVLLLGVQGARVYIKRILGWLSFSDTCRGLVDARAKNVVPYWNLQKEAKHRVWQAFWRAVLLDLAVKDENEMQKEKIKVKHKRKRPAEVTGTARLASLEEAVVASGLDRVKSHWYGKEHMYTAQLRRVAREALEGVDVFWNNPLGARDGHLDSVTCFGKMYVVPYPFQCVVVYDDAQDEAIITDECDESSPLSSHTNLAKLLFLNFTPSIMAKRELRQKLRVLSDLRTPIELPFTRTEKAFLGPKFLEWKWGIIPIFSMPGYYKFECKYMYGIIRVQTSTDKSGVLLRVNKSGAMKVFKRWVTRQFTRKGLADLKRWALKAVNTKAVQATRKTLSEMFHRIVPQPIREFFKSRGDTKREMADGFNVTIKYKDGRGEVEIPDTGKRFRVRGCRKTLMKADHVGLKPSMEESDILHNIFENTREVWEEGLKELHAKHRDYRQRLAKIQEEESAALSDDFWFFVYNDAHLSRDDLEQYLLENESNPALQALPKTRKAALDALYLRKKWVFLHPQITFWYVFWDDVYARNSGFKCLKPEDFDPLHPTAICYHLKEEGELKNWLRERKLLRRWGLFHDGLLKLLYDGMKKYEKKSNTKAIEAFRPWKA